MNDVDVWFPEGKTVKFKDGQVRTLEPMAIEDSIKFSKVSLFDSQVILFGQSGIDGFELDPDHDVEELKRMKAKFNLENDKMDSSLKILFPNDEVEYLRKQLTGKMLAQLIMIALELNQVDFDPGN